MNLFMRMKNKYLDMRIGTKLILLYLCSMLLIIAGVSAIYQMIYAKILYERVSSSASQTLSTVRIGIDSILENENVFSKIIIFDPNVQYLLNNSQELDDYSYFGKLMQSLSRHLEVNSSVSAIHIMDRSVQGYGVERSNKRSIDPAITSFSDIPWYDEVVRKAGTYILVTEGGGIFQNSDEEQFVTMARVINDINNFRPIGILMLNIPITTFEKSYQEICVKYNTGILILDENGTKVMQTLPPGLEAHTDLISGQIQLLSERELGHSTMEAEGVRYLLTRESLAQAPWTVVSIMPYQSEQEDLNVLGAATLLILFVTFLLLFGDAVFVSKFVTHPLKRLIASMGRVEDGNFQKIEIIVGKDEIGQFKDRYNAMTEQIKTLLEKAVEDQKRMRTIEQELLQAQIKPHFLYNTLDTISYLVLSEENKKAYSVTKSLGSYYRTCLSKGQKMITVQEEVDSVRNYLKIQKMRYGKLFRVSFHVADAAKECMVLKLLLQPLAENCLYHGIKPKGRGVIRITAERMGDMLELVVADDGVGMSAGFLRTLLSAQEDNNKGSFGLWGTLERIRIFYGVEDAVKIESAEGIGTKITIRVTAMGGNSDDKNRMVSFDDR
ncbi:cache domain-containing sensor histidine kinase [Diplocloster agilis]|uniref:cache domain-containing sensor histidine kinase n=1 Tax=Diplocloster agilis TaxID=2850323 RepID=UPI001EE8BD89|nr:sensor histidine kinase [Diplocloster agilis]